MYLCLEKFMTLIKVSVPGKVIISGEHSVVYGKPALVGAINMRIKVNLETGGEKQVIENKHKDLRLVKRAILECRKIVGKKIKGFRLKIESEIPVGWGLGSSAALATGIAYVFLKDYPEKVKDKVIKAVEDYQHGKSSGVDQMIVKKGGVIRYVKGGEVKPYKVRNLIRCLLVDSGEPVETTGEMVEKVSKGEYTDEFERMGEIASDWKPELIRENQRLLERIGVVGERAKKMVRQIEEIGGMAKVCGGGGVEKGSGMLLVYMDDLEKVRKLGKEMDWLVYNVDFGEEGVRYEKN